MRGPCTPTRPFSRPQARWRERRKEKPLGKAVPIQPPDDLGCGGGDEILGRICSFWELTAYRVPKSEGRDKVEKRRIDII